MLNFIITYKHNNNTNAYIYYSKLVPIVSTYIIINYNNVVTAVINRLL